MVRLLEAAPPQLRPTLAAAGLAKEVAVDWFEASSSVSAMLWRDSGLRKSEALQRACSVSCSELPWFSNRTV